MKRLLLGLVLIFFTSGILLLSDLQHRHSRSKSIHDIAVLQFNSRRVMDETVEGMIQGLKEKGFIHDNNISLAFFNAEGDLPTATAIAKEITSDKYKMVLTASTPCMQAVANANQNGNTIHVFCAVTDPFSAGVGLRREAPLDHPPHLVGVGTFQPVVETFELAKKVFPALQSVGVVWNPSEACSEACTKLARQISEKLDIKLVEANIDNSVAVKEAASSLAQKNIQAFYVGGDNTVDIAISVLIDVADKAGIPVFTNDPKNVQEGALFCLGANYRNVGIIAGQMAGDILSGQDPATIPIENRVPQKLYINKKSLSHLEQDWEFPPDILERADGVVDEQGSFTEKNQTIPISPVEQKTAGEASSRQKLPSDGKNEPFSVHVIKFLESPA
ncbi:ABC transporter substrate-binding protein, partial [candidate division KSB1 bacterium]|nr:ABC transporter substrate-binding protein [candidate division KSB1 bacterium]